MTVRDLLLRRQSVSGSLNLGTGRHSVKMRPNIGSNTLIRKGKMLISATARTAPRTTALEVRYQRF